MMPQTGSLDFLKAESHRAEIQTLFNLFFFFLCLQVVKGKKKNANRLFSVTKFPASLDFMDLIMNIEQNGYHGGAEVRA